MSDTWLALVPTDRHFAPAPDGRERAVGLLRGFAPAADGVTATVSEEIRFIDCGGNWCGVRCPACGADVEPWFADELGRCYERSRFRDLAAVIPCCEVAVSLDALVFGWPVGFARFVLEARNPGLEPAGLPPERHRLLEEAVGCPLRVIWRHY